MPVMAQRKLVVQRWASTEAAPVTPTEDLKTESKNRPKKRSEDYLRSQKALNIRNQVEEVVNEAKALDLSEAINILEEAVTYLRDVQGEEKITNRGFYGLFQRPLATLTEKVLTEGAGLGGRTPEQVLDLFIDLKVAHKAHFFFFALNELKKGGLDMYANVLRVWLRFLEYSKAMETFDANVHLSYEFPFLLEKGYRFLLLQQFAYLAFMMQCHNEGVKPSLDSISKLLQLQDPTQLPYIKAVRSAFAYHGVREFNDDLRTFWTMDEGLRAENADINSEYTQKEIKKALSRSHIRMLSSFYESLKERAVTKNESINEETLVSFMLGFNQLNDFETSFKIFGSMQEQGVRPTQLGYAALFKTIGHPDRILLLTEKERAEVGKTAEITLQSMLVSGVKMNQDVLSCVISCFANAGQSERVDQLTKEYEKLGLNTDAKNSILIGLLLNRKVHLAEKKFKEFLAKDPSYVPNTYTMNSFFSSYTRLKKFEEAEKVLLFMREKGIPEDFATITTAIDYYFKLMTSRGQVPDIVLIMNDLKQEHFRFTDASINSILYTLTSTGVNLEAARAVHKYFIEQTPKNRFSKVISTTMIDAELKYGSIYNAEALFKFHVDNMTNDTRMWNQFIRRALEKDDAIALKYYKKLKQQDTAGAQRNYFTFYFMFTHYMRTKQNDKLQWLLDELAKANLSDYGTRLPEIVDKLKTSCKVDPALAAKLKN